MRVSFGTRYDNSISLQVFIRTACCTQQYDIPDIDNRRVRVE